MAHLKRTFTYPVLILLGLILLADSGFIFGHLLHKFDVVSHPHFLLTKDRSYSEVFQYIKEFWIACLFLLVALRTNAMIYVAWALIFLYLLADDSLGLHESVGAGLVRAFDIPRAFGLRGQDFGELLITAIAAGILFTFLFIAYYFASQSARQHTHYLLALVAGIGFFGVVVDMAHQLIPWGKSLFGLIEDGGEMVIMSVVVAYCIALAFRCAPAGATNAQPATA